MKLEMKVDYSPGDTGEFISVDEGKCTGCGACWNVCSADAVEFSEPKGGTGVRFSYG